jgi:hypothetical protein
LSAERRSCQDQKDFNNEIKHIRCDLILNEYPKEFVHSLVKPLTRNHPSSDTIQGHCHYPYVTGISEKLRCIRNRSNLSIIFKTKRTLHGVLMKTGQVRVAQQTEQCVFSIPCDCGRCYIGETSGPLEVRIKEHKHNLS